MKIKFLAIIVTPLFFTPVTVLAANNIDMDGTAVLGIQTVDNHDNSYKLQEYRDLPDGVFGEINLNTYKGAYYLEMQGKNIGQEDQNYSLKGGEYNKFKYSFSYDDILHNLSFDDKTFYSGIGTKTLNITGGAVAPESDWTNFDYKIERKKYGGKIEISMDSPYYVSVGINRLETKGLKPLGTGGFSGETELPEPVNYTTNDLNMEAGYRSKTIIASVSGMISSFNNDNKYLTWEERTGVGTMDINALPPENDYNKISAKLIWRALAYRSTLALTGSYANLSNDYTVSDLNQTSLTAGSTNFKGDIDYTNASATFSSMPTSKLDSRMYYKYVKRKNNSSVVDYVSPADPADTDSNADGLFEYNTDEAGIDLGYKLPKRTKAAAGYEYLNTDRTNRLDATSTTDNSVYVQLRNNYLDYLTAKIKYKHLERSSDFGNVNTSATPTTSEYIDQFMRRFDATDKNQDKVKLSVEITPIECLDLSLNYSYKINKYNDITLGRTKDKRHEVYVDFTWRQSQMLTLNGFTGFEKTEADSNHYNFAAVPADPATLPNVGNTSYRWTQNEDTNFWTYGLTANVPLPEKKLHITLSWEYQKSYGSNDLTTEGTTALQNIGSIDNYTKKHLEAKAVYAFTEQIDFTLGFIYEKYKFDDLQYAGYILEPSGSYLTGAYSYPSYESNIGYLLARYSFN